MTREEFKCAVCGQTNVGHVLFFCDRTEGGPWCRDHLMEVTGCTDQAHGEGCLTQVFTATEEKDHDT